MRARLMQTLANLALVSGFVFVVAGLIHWAFFA
jgi:hypothetical protein